MPLRRTSCITSADDSFLTRLVLVPWTPRTASVASHVLLVPFAFAARTFVPPGQTQRHAFSEQLQQARQCQVWPVDWANTTGNASVLDHTTEVQHVPSSSCAGTQSNPPSQACTAAGWWSSSVVPAITARRNTTSTHATKTTAFSATMAYHALLEPSKVVVASADATEGTVSVRHSHAGS